MKLRRSVLWTKSMTSGESLLPANPERVAITFFVPNTGYYTVNPVRPAAAGDGINLVSGGSHVSLTTQQDGDIVQKPWNAIPSTTLTVTVLEVLCGEGD